jgi:DNA polymerase
MPDTTGDRLVRQARQHLEALKAAGLQWLPVAPMPQITGASRETATGPSLFEPSWEPPRGDDRTADERRHELKVLAERVSECPRCAELVSTRTQTVFGVGPVDPPLLLIGEAPGADEDRQGEPFVGAAGQLLNRILQACGFQREEVYICNVIKCRPPGNRTPKPEEAANCREYLDRQIELVRPKFICCLGGTAALHLLGVPSLARLRGRVHDYKGIPVVCTYHPAYLLPHRQPAKKKEVWEDMLMMLRRMGREIPKPAR